MDMYYQLYEDLEYISNAEFIPWERLKNKTIFITGATGLIGYTLVNALVYVNHKKGLNLKVIILVRQLKNAKEQFCKIADDEALKYVVGSVEMLPDIMRNIDYIIHGASITDSQSFVRRPVETIMTAIKGTKNILELAKNKDVSGMLYLSSMEVYGYPKKGHKVEEREIGALCPLEVRNSYPISKIQCENLCCSYVKEYGVPAIICRLTQTFGLGVKYNDRRVFAEFARCAIEKKDIVLKTKGETERSYLYTADAITAILTVLLKGISGQAYNLADESTYCSISKMAEAVAKKNGISVKYDIQDNSSNGYANVLYMDLSTSKLMSLGWMPMNKDERLDEMYKILINYMKFIKDY